MKILSKSLLALCAIALFVAAPSMSSAQRVELIQNGNLDAWSSGDPVGWDMVQTDSGGTPGGAAVVNEETVTVKSGSSMSIPTGGGFTFRYVAHTNDWGAMDVDLDWTVSIFGLAGVDRTRVYVAVQTNGVGPFVTSFAAGFGGANGVTGVGDPPAGWNDYSGTFPAGTFTGGANGTDRYRFTIHAIDAGSFVDDVSLSYIRNTAGPYAGLIRMGTTTVIDEEGTTITYVLPYDVSSTGTVTVDILDSGDSVVATFPGTTSSGLNTIVWDGTDTNSSGTLVAQGTGYRVRITVLNETPEAWYVAQYNGSTTTGGGDGGPGNIFGGFSPIGVDAQPWQDSDAFGLLHARNSTNFGSGIGASVILRGDLQPWVGDGYDDRRLRHPSEPAPGNEAAWGADFLPNSDIIFQAGQTIPYHTGGNAFALNAVDLAGTYTLLNLARDAEVVDENGQLWAYMAAGTSVIDKVRLDSNGFATTNSINVLSGVSLGESLYSKDLEFDDDGNMYWLSRDARLFRWDAADVQAITNPGDAALLGAAASWDVTFDVGLANRRTMGVAVSGGKVYVGAVNAATETSWALYEIGDVSTASLVKNVDTPDIVLTGGRFADGIDTTLDIDGVGHVVVYNRSPENIRLLAPGGLSRITTVAPASQVFDIVGQPPLSVPDWFMHY